MQPCFKRRGPHHVQKSTAAKLCRSWIDGPVSFFFSSSGGDSALHCVGSSSAASLFSKPSLSSHLPSTALYKNKLPDRKGSIQKILYTHFPVKDIFEILTKFHYYSASSLLFYTDTQPVSSISLETGLSKLLQISFRYLLTGLKQGSSISLETFVAGFI